ncbi:Aldehyde dehydrogenase, thermostable [Tsuneonella dongtanensis]|uniref:Aldehyde dehydrogenase, thermostable n=1 Tax=Tsuneonella dongtanensis TaxID=692370 RepID=A0A1B2A913_9SPHN|nr:aldehyde dehydrogenase family protein [Tsuneonella dongtanensis]ANY18650.1 Aldehyde dehydrogenase, thermostable [Tsuneonella dongtanensis]
METQCNFIGGEWVGASTAQPNINPSDTSDIVGHYAQGGTEDVNRAISAAREALPTWSRATPQERCDILDRAGALILERKNELGRLLSREEGKTLAEGIGEAARAGQIFKYYAGEALRLSGELLRSTRPAIDVEIRREPVGVVALITPWNFPLAIPAWKAAPALAFGNTVVLKPAELVPASAHALTSILAEAGMPRGVFNLLMGPGHTLGDALVKSAEVDAVSFTGSVSTGRAIAATRAASGRRVQCEMGGKNPMVVLDDADIDVAVNSCLNGAFFSTGQRCTASSRLIVTAGIYDRFVELLVERMLALRVGHALDVATEIGPVVDERQLKQDLSYIDLARKEGARIVGGDRPKLATDGYYLTPTLFLETDPEMRINQEEIFGPIASVIRADDDDQALMFANAVPFGLSAGVCTTSLGRARRFRDELQAGMVMINLPTAGVDYHVPFGGTKESSFGPREQGSHAREFYTVTKTSYVA